MLHNFTPVRSGTTTLAGQAAAYGMSHGPSVTAISVYVRVRMQVICRNCGTGHDSAAAGFTVHFLGLVRAVTP
jgi:hypothetical protein